MLLKDLRVFSQIVDRFLTLYTLIQRMKLLLFCFVLFQVRGCMTRLILIHTPIHKIVSRKKLNYDDNEPVGMTSLGRIDVTQVMPRLVRSPWSSPWPGRLPHEEINSRLSGLLYHCPTVKSRKQVLGLLIPLLLFASLYLLPI